MRDPLREIPPGQHTPGPWTAYQCLEITGGSTPWTINADRKTPVCGVSGASLHVGQEQADANARLIAAAPDLLEACKWALANMKGSTGDHMRLMNAIDKATGGAE